MDAQDRTLGEVARRLDEIFNRFDQVANDLPKTFVSREVFDAYKELAKTQADALKITIDASEKRIEALEDDKKWLYRLIVGAVILALLGLVLGASRLASPPTSSHTGSQRPSTPVSQSWQSHGK